MSGRVLIVDDDQSMAETLTKAMTRRGFIVSWCTSAVEGLQQASYALSQHMQGAAGAAPGADGAPPEATASNGKPDEEVIDAEFEKKS